MDATEAYHREVARTQSDAPEAVRALLPRLRDPAFTRVVLVALPEPTPVHEAIHLAEDLRRAGIEPAGWVINRSFAATGPTEPILAGKAAQEGRSVADAAALGLPLAILPWTADLG
jgi:arsenite-transporting ATPase